MSKRSSFRLHIHLVLGHTSSHTALISHPSMNPSFVLDYEGPASFYKLLSVRNNANPLFLSRQLKPEKTKLTSRPSAVSIHISSPRANFCGKVVVSLVLATTLPNQAIETELLENQIQTIDAVKGKTFDKMLVFNVKELKTMPLDKYLLLVIIYQPSASETNRSAANAIPRTSLIESVEKALSTFSSVKHATTPFSRSSASLSSASSTNMCVVDLLPPARGKGTAVIQPRKPFSPQKSSKAHNMGTRSQFWPSSTHKRLISLSPKLWPALTVQSREVDEDDYALEISVQWIHNTKPLPSSELTDGSTSAMVNYHYLYFDSKADAVRAIVEKRRGAACPWCSFTSKSSSNSLLLHLRNSHFHFSYEPVIDPHGHLHIVVRRERLHDDDSSTILRECYRPYFLLRNQRQHMFKISIPKLAEDPTFQADASDSAAALSQAPACDASVDGMTQSLKMKANRHGNASAPLRQYYHARLGLPVHMNEDFYDSDHEIDSSWDLVASNRALDEFEDVSFEEKEFMKLWNTYIHSTIAYSDSYLAMDCERFAEEYASVIVKKNLRHNFSLHLYNMWDFGLLRADDIQRFLVIVDRRQQEILSGAHAGNMD
jgi:hypothetical protein